MTGDDPRTAFLDALQQLPPYVGVVFRGADGVAPAQPIQLPNVLAASLDPRIATENAASPGLFAIVSKTGRAIGPMSAHPDEHEVVLLPGTVLGPIARVAYPPFGEVTVLEEFSATPAPGLPGTLQALADHVYRVLGAAAAAPDRVIHSPGKFRGR